MNTSKILSKKKRALYEDGYMYDANLGPWESIAEYESFIHDSLGLANIRPGVHIQVYEKNGSANTGRVVEYMYDASKSGASAWVMLHTNNAVKFAGVLNTAIASATTNVPCDSSAMYWVVASGSFVFKVGSKYYNQVPNMAEFCDAAGKPYDNTLYISGTTVYMAVDGALKAVAGDGAMTTPDSAIAAAIANYDKTAAKSIAVRTVNGVKSIALLNSNNDVMSSISLDEIGMTIVPVLDAPTIVVKNNVCTITSTSADAQIYWNYDADPVVSAVSLYKGPFEVEYNDIDDSVEIRAIAMKGGVKSAVASVDAEKVVLVSTPVIRQLDNTITMACSTANSVIYYTTDGSTPSATNGVAYKGGFGMTKSCTVNAIAIANGNKSDVASLEFVYTAEEEDNDAVKSPFVVATWNTGRWSLGTSFYPSSTLTNETNTSASNYYKKIAKKIKDVLKKIDPANIMPAVLMTQETNENFTRWGVGKTDVDVFDEFENKIHPRSSDSSVTGFYRNAIYTRSMSQIVGEPEVVETYKDYDDNNQGYYTHAVVMIDGKEVHLVSTHFDPSGGKKSGTFKEADAIQGSLNRQRIAAKIIADMEQYQYVIVAADFNTREWSLMPSVPYDYNTYAGNKYYYDAKYPCGFAAAGYSCASGAAGSTTMITDKNTTPVTTTSVLINGSGTNFFKVDNILVKGLKISNVGMINVSDDENDVDGNTKLADHDIIYCTVSFE